MPSVIRETAAALCLTSMMATPIGAETIIECGGSQGKGYYFGIDSSTQAQIGWIDDGMKDGAIVLVRNGDTFDVIIKDAVGTISSIAEGVTVRVIDAQITFLMS